jgi:hypothetical protein
MVWHRRPEDGGGKFLRNVDIYQTKERKIPEDNNIHRYLYPEDAVSM